LDYHTTVDPQEETAMTNAEEDEEQEGEDQEVGLTTTMTKYFLPEQAVEKRGAKFHGMIDSQGA
jgi:hypothetical protein